MSIKLGEKSTSHLPLLPPGTSEVDLKPIASWGRTSAIVFILPVVGHLSRGMGLAYTTSLPFLLILLWFLPFLKKNLWCWYRHTFFFGHAAPGILVPGPGMESASPVSKVWNLNHWTTREFPCGSFFISLDVEDLLCWSSGLPHL